MTFIFQSKGFLLKYIQNCCDNIFLSMISLQCGGQSVFYSIYKGDLYWTSAVTTASFLTSHWICISMKSYTYKVNDYKSYLMHLLHRLTHFLSAILILVLLNIEKSKKDSRIIIKISHEKATKTIKSFGLFSYILSEISWNLYSRNVIINMNSIKQHLSQCIHYTGNV